MIKKIVKLGLLIGLLSIISCEADKEEIINVKLKYQHEYPEANYRYYSARPILPQRHHINIKDFIQKNIYDETDLNENLSGVVNVPIDIQIEVNYSNFTSDVPTIAYQTGTSDPFKVYFNSPSPFVVTIPVSVNPNYPVQETETVDNETIETTITTILSWSDNFTKGISPTQTQMQSYKNFWDDASNYVWDNISIGNSDNMTMCDNSSLISEISLNIENSTYNFQGKYCNGMYWTMGKCGAGNEISAFPLSVRDCQCRQDGYVIRPLIGNANWGGVGKSCSADSQTLKIILEKDERTVGR